MFYCYNRSVALVVDDPVLYNRILETFHSRATIKFVILLWGQKSSIRDVAAAEIPVYSYDEITSLGRESHTALLLSEDASKLLCCHCSVALISDCCCSKIFIA